MSLFVDQKVCYDKLINTNLNEGYDITDYRQNTIHCWIVTKISIGGFDRYMIGGYGWNLKM